MQSKQQILKHSRSGTWDDGSSGRNLEYWNHKDQLLGRWNVHNGFYHMWQYLQTLYNAATWNSGESSPSTERHFQKNRNAWHELSTSPGIGHEFTDNSCLRLHKVVKRKWLMLSAVCINIIITRRHLSSVRQWKSPGLSRACLNKSSRWQI